MNGYSPEEQATSLLHNVLAAQPHPLLFATLSGAHLYGFPSPDSDFDLRGVHLLPPRLLLGLDVRDETIEWTGNLPRADHPAPATAGQPRPDATSGEYEIDLVTHDARKFFRLLLQRNGYVLEQLYSPLILHTTPAHAELKDIARGCVTRHHAHHYLGFVRTQWGLFEKERRLKPLLYTYRVLLTGLHLMRTGLIEANLPRLNEDFRLPYLPDLIARKTTGTEKGTLPDADIAFHESECRRLTADLEAARDASPLPDEPSARPALEDLLLRLRGLTPEER